MKMKGWLEQLLSGHRTMIVVVLCLFGLCLAELLGSCQRVEL